MSSVVEGRLIIVYGSFEKNKNLKNGSPRSS